MIVPLTGNVSYPITLDPTVWIFDDRKILLEEAFIESTKEVNDQNEALKRTAANFDREVSQQIKNPPVNKSISRYERDKILVNSYVMPLKVFLGHAEVKTNAIDVTLVTETKNINISLEDLENCYLLFAIKGKPLIADGPVHLYYQDGSNKDNPIKGVKKIIVN